jgi:mannose-6-phosphate isomerase-like protein (cupin superfamily)
MSSFWTNTPPDARVPYAIPQLEGERITIPGSKGAFRILASSKQTNGLMAVFQSGAVLSDAPGFHYHNHAHDVFLVTKGYLKLWNGDKCRIMGPGDFAYVPPVRPFSSFCPLRAHNTDCVQRESSTTPNSSALTPKPTA